jgi:flagellar motor protein MotB
MASIAVVMLAVIVAFLFYDNIHGMLDEKLKKNKIEANYTLAQAPLPFVKDEIYKRKKDETMQKTISEAVPIRDEKENATPGAMPQKKQLPSLDIAGIEIREENGGKLLVFEEPLFRKREELSETGKLLLTALIEELKPFAAGIKLVITGHTDSDALPPNSPFKDNKELGMARAEAATQFIKKIAGETIFSIVATTAGAEKPPYPENTPENKAKNRTVTILIISN